MKIGFSGLSGRMGKVFLDRIGTYPSFELVVGFGKERCVVGGIEVFTRLEDSPYSFDVLVDFSRPEFLLSLLKDTSNKFKSIVSGTTGFSPDQMKTLTEHAHKRLVFWAPNFSIGVFALSKAIQLLGPMLQNWNAAVTETHHIHKVDAPSGTAKWLLKSLNRVGGPEVSSVHSLRLAEHTGSHSVVFASGRETLTLTHQAEDRQVFVDGVFSVLNRLTTQKLWQKPGFLSLADVFGTPKDPKNTPRDLATEL